LSQARQLEQQGRLKAASTLYQNLIAHGTGDNQTYRHTLLRLWRHIASHAPTAANYFDLSEAEQAAFDFEAARKSLAVAKKLDRSHHLHDQVALFPDRNARGLVKSRQAQVATKSHLQKADRFSQKRQFDQAIQEYRLALGWDDQLWSLYVLGKVPSGHLSSAS